VETGRVILLEQDSDATAASSTAPSTMIFQASGWLEPAPWPINLAVKVDGFVDQVFVKEGEVVTNGQIVAQLDPTDARLALELAAAHVRKHNAALTARKNAATATEKQAEAAQFRVESASARLSGASDTWERFSKTSANVISFTERVTAEQAVVELEALEKEARAALSAQQAKTIEAHSEISVAEAAQASALKGQEVAQLALERTVIRSDLSGIVLHRYVQPGDKRVLKTDDPNSAVIASIYDPAHLQVRVDVPLAEAGKLIVDQPAHIFTAMLPGQNFTGRVTRIVGMADLQRNTLQAKVAIDAPDARLRPDVLCRVEFMSARSPSASGPTTTGRYALWIPTGALQSDAPEQPVWVVDPLTQTATQRIIKLSTTTRTGFRKVTDGLRANEVVVLSGQAALSEGARVKEVSK
jgi:HlyD family secretion protein